MNPYISGATIKKLREHKNLTQAQLAAQLHLSDKTISKWETGCFIGTATNMGYLRKRCKL